MAVPGTFYELSGTVYVFINKEGTIRKFLAVKWYKILFLTFLQAFGKKKHVQEVIDYLK